MNNTDYEYLPDELYENYLKGLIGKFFKIIPLSEDNSPTLNEFITNLLIEMTGAQPLIIILNNDGRYLVLLSSLSYLLNNDYTFKECKSQIFKCIRIIEDLNKEYFPKGES